jgi:hypothetical protein
MKTKLLAVMLLAGGSMFAQSRLSVGVNVGGFGAGYTQTAIPYGYAVPPSAGPDYAFVDGYWSQDHGHRLWVSGFWQRRPFVSHSARFEGRFDNRFNDRDRGSNRGFEQSRDGGQNSRSNGFRGR